MRLPIISRLTTAIIVIFITGMSFQAGAQLPFPDTLWVPVIFYDYHADGRADFETCEDPNSDVGRKGMVLPTLDAQRKPVPVTSVACPTIATSFPCACHLSEWFRVSGQNGSDATGTFECDSVTDPDRPLWSWTGLVPYQGRAGEYTGPNYNADYEMANVIIYDSLGFDLVEGSEGVYRFNNDEFFPLDGRGFGNEPRGLREPHNFGFTMELHTKFEYKKGLTFSFRGDDDVWAFINGKLVMDLGGLHYYMDGFIDLDTIADLVEGEIYDFDLFYAERHSTGSHIHITSNVITARPSEVEIAVFPSDTIKAGDTALIIGTVTDEDGERIPVLSDSIVWTQYQENAKEGDRIIIPRNDTTQFTATAAYRRIGIIGTYQFGNTFIVDTTWLHIVPADPSQVDINLQNATALTREEVESRIDTFSVAPRQTITIGMGQTSAYAYAVLRDRFGNFCSLADTSIWTSRNTAAATVTYQANGAFEGRIVRPTGVMNASTMVIVSREALTPDTADVVMVADTLIALRLVAGTSPDVAIDTVYLATDSSATVIMQGIWSTNPGVWTDITGTWTLQPSDAITFATPVPVTTVGQWTITPRTSGTTQLTVQSLNASTSVPVIAKNITRLRLVDANPPGNWVSAIRMTTDSTLTVKLQGTWSDNPDTWVDLTGVWSLNPLQKITFDIPLPGGEAGQWTITPSSAGSTQLTVTSHGDSVTVPVFVSLADLTGPYVQKAIFTPGSIDSTTDRLQVFFSEPVSCDSLTAAAAVPGSSFKVIGPGDSVKTDAFDGARYAGGECGPGRFVSEITILTKVNSGRFIPGVDSLLLFGNVVDTAGNAPEEIRGPMVYGPGSGISVLPITNSDPSVSPMVVPDAILQRFGLDVNSTEGKVMVLQARRPLVPVDTLPDGKISYGTAIIYDVVGNVVALNLPVIRSLSSDRIYAVYWNCRNRSKRRVAAGAYLFTSSVVYNDRRTYVESDKAKFTIRWKR